MSYLQSFGYSLRPFPPLKAGKNKNNIKLQHFHYSMLIINDLQILQVSFFFPAIVQSKDLPSACDLRFCQSMFIKKKCLCHKYAMQYCLQIMWSVSKLKNRTPRPPKKPFFSSLPNSLSPSRVSWYFDFCTTSHLLIYKWSHMYVLCLTSSTWHFSSILLYKNYSFALLPNIQ